MAASNTPSDPGAWLANPSSVADTKAAEMVKKSSPPTDGIRLYMASDEQPRSASPMPIWMRVDKPPGSTMLNFLTPIARGRIDAHAT
jgi:hypothetical protein